MNNEALKEAYLALYNLKGYMPNVLVTSHKVAHDLGIERIWHEDRKVWMAWDEETESFALEVPGEPPLH